MSSPAMSTIVPAELAPDLAPETQARFCATLSQWGNVRAAAQQVGVSRAHLYRMRRASSQFREMWDAALLLARPQVEEVLADRALNGVQEVVYYHGEEVATRTRYDSRLLLAHLARLDKLGTTFAIAAAARDFDTRLEWLARGPIVDDGVGDEDYDDAEDYCEEDFDEEDCEDEDYAEEDYEADADDDADGAPEEPADDGCDLPVPEDYAEGRPAAADGAAGDITAPPPHSPDFSLLDSVSCVSNTPPEEASAAEPQEPAPSSSAAIGQQEPAPSSSEAIGPQEPTPSSSAEALRPTETGHRPASASPSSSVAVGHQRLAPAAGAALLRA